MSDKREYPPGPEHPAGHPPAAVPAGHPGVRPGPPAPAAAAPPRWPVRWPGRRVRVPSPPVRSRCSPIGCGGRLAVVGVPRRAGRTPGPAGNAARRPPRRPRAGYGPPPGPPPARSGPGPATAPAAVRLRRGRPRWPRRLVWTLVALLGLGLLAPVVAFLVGWMMFDVPSANQTGGHPGRDVQVRRRRRAGHHPPGQRQPHERHRWTRCPSTSGTPCCRPRTGRSTPTPGSTSPASAGRCGTRPPAASAAARPSPSSTSRSPPGRTPRRCGASTRRSCSRSRSPRSRPRTRSSRTT